MCVCVCVRARLQALKEHHVSPAEIAAILCEADEDGDGEISWDEFQTMMRLLD